MNRTSGTSSLTRRRLLKLSTAGMAMPFVLRDAAAQGKAINVGVIMPLSGANAQFGINSRNGIELVATHAREGTLAIDLEPGERLLLRRAAQTT